MTALTPREPSWQAKRKKTKEKETKTHIGVGDIVLYLSVCISWGLFILTADRDNHGRDVASELGSEICCSIVLFVCFEDQSAGRTRAPFQNTKDALEAT